MEQDVEKKNQEVSPEVVSPRINESMSILDDSPTTQNNTFTSDLIVLQKYAEYAVTSGLCPLKKNSDVVQAILTGRELGLSPIVSINNIFPIAGKPAISTHIIKGLLITNDILFEKSIDYKPVYGYLKEVKNDKGEVKQVPAGSGFLEDKPSEFKQTPSPIDYITEYTFSRIKKRIDGSFKEIISSSRFSMKDAQIAELLDKDVWKKYPKRMLEARAFIIGAREIASDIIFGMYSVNELADSNNVEYNISANLEESVK
jgi:hypothetical protein